MMTSDKEIIKEKTGGYEIGKLYLEDDKKEIELSKSEDACFDDETGNFHLYPFDSQTMMMVSREVSDNRDKILASLKNKLPNDIELISGTGSRGFIKTLYDYEKYKGANRLYKFIVVKKNDTFYTLNFMRFFVDNGEKVNCILKSMQFERSFTEKGYINPKRKGKFDICYPTSHSSMDDKYIITKSKKDRNFCFNPNVEFTDVEGTTEAFVNFINICEKSREELRKD